MIFIIKNRVCCAVIYLSNVWHHGNATDIPLNIRRGDDVNVTVCDQNNHCEKGGI